MSKSATPTLQSLVRSAGQTSEPHSAQSPHATSPCIDAGDKTAIPADLKDVDEDSNLLEETPDLDWDVRVQYVTNCEIDRGPFEHRPEDDCGAADLDSDGQVGVPDLLLLLEAWGSCADCNECPADFDQSCTVGVPDLLELLGCWGELDSCENRGDVPESVEDCWDRYSHDFELFEDCVEAVEEVKNLLEE